MPEPQGLADAFADFDLPQARTAPVAGAVDITAIEVPREKPPEPPPPPPPPEPPKPAYPSRVWVQVATGKDTAALAFDWRRFSRSATDLLKNRKPYTAKWGETNRMVTGPFDSRKAALEMVDKLKAEGIDSFMFVSDEGQEVKPLG